MRGRKERFKAAQIAEALRKGAGISSAAARILGCTPSTIRNYLDRYPKLQAEVTEQVEANLDIAEAKLLTAIQNGEHWAVQFYLETKGRARGYSRRQEIAGVAGQPVVVTDARQWITDQLTQMGDRLRLEPSRENGPAGTGGESEATEETVH